jgi:hypothetical protein
MTTPKRVSFIKTPKHEEVYLLEYGISRKHDSGIDYFYGEIQ